MVLGAQVGGRQAIPFAFCNLGLNVGIVRDASGKLGQEPVWAVMVRDGWEVSKQRY